jgi:hypothetical protein
VCQGAAGEVYLNPTGTLTAWWVPRLDKMTQNICISQYLSVSMTDINSKSPRNSCPHDYQPTGCICESKPPLLELKCVVCGSLKFERLAEDPTDQRRNQHNQLNQLNQPWGFK